MILVSPIFLPIYLLRTRGFTRTAWVIFLFVLKYIALGLVAYALLLGLSALGVRVLLG